MKTIGLTGGIGTGKSTVSSLLKEKGCIILDADIIARKITEDGSVAIEEIAREFGEQYLISKGKLDRKALGDLVFNDKDALERLQNIVTQKAVEEVKERLIELKASGTKDIVVIDAPLLFECGLENLADENWLVTTDLIKRIDRVKARDGLSEEQIISRINSQMPETEKKKLSNVIIDNSESIEDTRREIEKQLERIHNEI